VVHSAFCERGELEQDEGERLREQRGRVKEREYMRESMERRVDTDDSQMGPGLGSGSGSEGSGGTLEGRSEVCSTSTYELKCVHFGHSKRPGHQMIVGV